MKIQQFLNEEDWLEARLGKITGTRLKDLLSGSSFTKEEIVSTLDANKITFDPKSKVSELDSLLSPVMRSSIMLSRKKKKGFYEIIAERVALPDDGEFPMNRGKRLEAEAIEQFSALTKKKVNTDLVMWSRDENDDIAISPDGQIGKTEAVEVKCLNSASHIEAQLTGEIPSEFGEQIIQYFIVNDSLEKLYFVFYDPRMPIPLFYNVITRKSVQDKVTEYLELERAVLLEIEDIVKQLTF